MKQAGSNWLIVFVKAPSAGEVKTRMLGRLSSQEAAQLYRCLVLDTLKAVIRVPQIRVVVAYAANRTFPDLRWLEASLPMFLQSGTTLGERLVHAFRWSFDQHADRVVVMGSDAPDLSGAWVRRAFQELRQCEVVVGPTVDGGYHLIGLTQPHPELFVDMPWSSPRLFGRTLQRIGELGLAVRCLEPVADLDTPEDLHQYRGQPRVLRRHSHTARYLRTIADCELRLADFPTKNPQSTIRPPQFYGILHRD